PCGPNSEIFYDRGLAYDLDNIGIDLLAKDIDNDRYIEIWNIVFSQFNAQDGVERKDYKPLPQKNIDTGMGLERLTSIIQEAPTNFETDLFTPIILEISNYAKYEYEGEHKKAYRVIADHIRAITFALADGAMFSNEGRGYVLKRLLRRASRYGLELGIEEPFLYHLVDSVVDVMNDYYPYLNEKADLIAKIIKSDEERFHKTLASGLKMFEDVRIASTDKVIYGEQAFRLYDTYGFPIEIIQELSDEAGYSVDMDGFNKLMEHQKEMARASFKDGSNMKAQAKDLLDFKSESTFVGYSETKIDAKIIGLFKDGEKVEVLEGQGEIAFDNTVFYAQSGGQIADRGHITINGIEIEVIDVRKAPNGQHLHLVDTMPIRIGDKANLEIDVFLRKLTARNHSATHLLHQALKDCLGNHVNQAGSYVTDEYLRFDFSHFEKVSFEDLELIETKINDLIFSGLDVKTDFMDIDSAKEQGAQALFGDKYDDIVRVVSMGDFSIELCGGTHVNKIEELGLFKIIKEESVGSGIRRIIATTSKTAYELLSSEVLKLDDIAVKIGVNDTTKINKKIDNILKVYGALKQEVEQYKEKFIESFNNSNEQEYIMINDHKVFITEVVTPDVKVMKSYIDSIKNEQENA
ncbi:MAG: alanine--tRNA ligase, partial [Erysipelotrichales bacterium]